MKLKSFNIRNYKSIQDTGDVQLCRGRIATLAGQNESGKSSILEAVRDFEEHDFSEDSIPFGSEQSTQEITCVFELEKTDYILYSGFKKRNYNIYKNTNTESTTTYPPLNCNIM